MLTEKQRSLFLYIHKCLEEKGLAPTYEEIMQELGIKSRSNVSGRLQALINRGLVKKYPFYSRGLEILRFPEYLKKFVEESKSCG